MSLPAKRLRLNREQDFPEPNEMQDLLAGEDPIAEEESEEEANTPISSASNLTPPPSPAPSTSSSSCPSSPSSLLSLETPEEAEEFAALMLRLPLRPLLSPLSPSSSSSSSLCLELDEEPGSQEELSLSVLLSSSDSESSQGDSLGAKVNELVRVLLLRYQLKVPITRVEMLQVITKQYQHQFSRIFEKAAEFLELIFGIDIKEKDPPSNCYVLANCLDLTYEERGSGDQIKPRNGFLLIILGVIFIEGNCAPEESIWEFLNMMGVYDGQEHFIYGEPREFMTRDLVQQNYLEYRQVPSSDPPRHEFLWGPRAYAETTKMKVLEFLAKVKGGDALSFSEWYEEALRDEEERAQDLTVPLDGGAAMFTVQHWSAASPDPSEESDH